MVVKKLRYVRKQFRPINETRSEKTRESELESFLRLGIHKITLEQNIFFNKFVEM